ncbi:hypothetical protein F4815DRAFT_446325 [Daldinia loculata]|nr:hypothetical protein F4815DRAFT_446325 [Daldinia loculata]
MAISEAVASTSPPLGVAHPILRLPHRIQYLLPPPVQMPWPPDSLSNPVVACPLLCKRRHTYYPPQWKELYGHKPPGHLELTKDKKYHSVLEGEPVIINLNRYYHGYVRKLLAHGFSDKMLREQDLVI